MNEEGARHSGVSRWFMETTIGEVAATLPPVYTSADVEIGLAHVMAADMQYSGGMDDHVAVRFTVAEIDGRNPLTFHGEIKRSRIQEVLDLFRKNVQNFNIGRERPLRVVDDGKA